MKQPVGRLQILGRHFLFKQNMENLNLSKEQYQDYKLIELSKAVEGIINKTIKKNERKSK